MADISARRIGGRGESLSRLPHRLRDFYRRSDADRLLLRPRLVARLALEYTLSTVGANRKG